MDEKRFDNLELEISVIITNDEITELEFDTNNIWLNITHLDENDKIVFETTLRKVKP